MPQSPPRLKLSLQEAVIQSFSSYQKNSEVCEVVAQARCVIGAAAELSAAVVVPASLFI